MYRAKSQRNTKKTQYLRGYNMNIISIIYRINAEYTHNVTAHTVDRVINQLLNKLSNTVGRY